MIPDARRTLRRLLTPDAVLQTARTGEGFAVYPGGDRRRRPMARMSAEDARRFCSDGVLAQNGEAFVLTEAGRNLLRRDGVRETEAFAEQHRPIVDRAVADRAGAIRMVRGHDGSAHLRRLQALKDTAGAPLLNADELAAAAQLQADWERSQAGLVRGSDWAAAPLGSGARGVSNAQERAMAVRCDAHARIARALDALAAPLRCVVLAVCCEELGLEGLERREKWPARSGKLALKLGLAQVAGALRSSALSGARGELDAVHHREEAV
ncbi:MAG: DUF6456 domain-containing protein [Terricaulis sp.]